MRGLSFDQVGVTEAMVETYGAFIWEHSTNLQTRRGDPYRLKDWDDIERQRPAMGLSDGQIAEKLGLTRDQVLLIRVLLTARKFQRRHYYRLYELGGGKRFRAERQADEGQFSPEAAQLRASIRFDPAQIRKFIAEGTWGPDTLSGWLHRCAKERGDHPAIIAASGTLTWREVATKVEQLAVGLHETGIRHGDVVAVQLPNIPEFLISYLAITRLGGVMATMHMPYRDAELSALLRHGRARALICLAHVKDYSPAAAVLRMKDGLPTLRQVIALGGPIEGAVSFDALERSDGELPETVGPNPADPFLMLFTSGTSASPKAVPLTYQATLGNARLSAPEHGLTQDDTILSAAPFTHLFGQYSFHLALSVGAASVLLPMFTPPDLSTAIGTFRPTALFTAPAHMAAMIKTGLIDKTDLSSLKLVICSGSACPADLARAVQARMPLGAFTQLWGMTETQAGLYGRPGDTETVRAETAGRPSPGTEIRIVDQDGNAVPPGEEGELQVRGSLMFSGYYDNAEANDSAFTKDGWFRTGDLALQDSARNVQITGRSKEIINRGGVKYNPRDIEDLLDAHPKVLQSAIVPMSDAVLGEKACCFIVAKGEAPDLEELCAHLAGHGIAKYKLPERLEIVAEMPMTPTRKIIKGRLVSLLTAANKN